ncbi:hypothetical protein L3Y34_010373 [Caenorhabditis briggsae]|uniref:Uncharacterized protein n=1 Tax=Caenorhabditis briggsae TaxID=6238 RepID=A0AAE8ZLF8_CAEBR|nr:hypothetical protein L3Y34_010373 [Caenorhabditis briggsae]
MIPVIIDEDEINKDGEVIDEENQENDQTRNIGLDDTKQNNLAEINGEFIEAVEEIDLKFDEMEASEGHYHIDKEMEEVEMEKEAKRGTEEEAIEELRDEREKVVSHVETEEIERVGELVKDKEDHTGSTLKEELTVAVNTVMGAKEWKVATKAHFKKYLETISKPIDTMQIFNATGQMLRKAENNKNMREFRSEVSFYFHVQKYNSSSLL